jgi:hypothetical protein
VEIVYIHTCALRLKIVAKYFVDHRVLLTKCTIRSEEEASSLATIWHALTWIASDITAEFDALLRRIAKEHNEYLELEQDKISQRLARVRAARQQQVWP